MKERIITFLEAINLGSSQFAGEIGVQPSGISHILSGRNNPSLDFVLKVLNRYPDLSSEWLLFGRGEMFRDTDLSINAESDILSSNERESSHLTPAYNTDLFTTVETPGSTGMDKSEGRDRTGGKMTTAADLPDNESQPAGPGNGNENVTEVSSAVSADRMILVYCDGTFEQFKLRRDNSRNPLPESDK